ncbi:hypothetical protein AB6A40_009229 [Gnathostoma spinigerum]|uniref:Epidermal growth factor receptor substrate 15-like 1 n=1 Tax=Gnathostoma spinigerum TaxID=75299 RepID=A0ABD6ERC4_9BILA
MSEVGMRPHSVQPHSVTSSSPPLCASLATSTQEWPVQVSKYESEFKKADTNKDGLVSGIDVREYLIASTVPQTVLAQLWSLVDFRKNGMLNIEQFALIMHLIDEWKSGIPAPSVLPPFLIPPQFRSIGASSTSLSLQADSSSLSSGNEELDMVQNEIQDLILERRQIDLDIVQLEADLTIKNSEIKNLEIELSTLENTVLQLERQKSEANRRLGLLDEQIEQLERNSVNLKEKLCEEQQRVNRLRKEAEDKENNASVVNDQLTAAKSELAAVEEENRKTKAELSQGKAEVEKISVQLTNLERDISNVENKKMNVEKEAEKSSKISSRLSELLEAKDIETIIMEQAELLGTKTLVSQNKSVSGAVLKTSMASDPFKETSATASDPFGSDPFAGTNSSFAAFDDQFGGRFNANPFDDSSSPFSMTGTAESSATPRSASVPIGSSKLPPPRPAPPKTVQSFSALNEPDPFSSSEATEKSGSAPGCQGGFADFSAAFS